MAGIIFYSVLPLSFGEVRFWPQVVIPAVFAVIFGPWVGGFGAALGIFVNDLVLGGNPLLSLLAGVTSNFVAFWLIGYIANIPGTVLETTAILKFILVPILGIYTFGSICRYDLFIPDFGKYTTKTYPGSL